MALRTLIRDRVHGLVGSGGKGLDLERPAGDPGLFGPGSVSWRVHADFTSMMIGGTAALLLQMLHPRALAGVWDHSDFRHDMNGRLRRTAQFIAGTTYGSTATAEALIAKVRAIHDHVSGTLPDGTPYSANDPDLLAWIHVAEVRCFLAAHRRYRDPAISAADRDRYYAESADIARRLGAADLPTSERAVEAYFGDVRPQLRVDERTRAAAAALFAHQAAGSLGLAGAVLREAAVDLLPPWAAAMHGFPVSAPRRQAARLGAMGIGGLLRWALTEGSSASRARRRVDA